MTSSADDPVLVEHDEAIAIVTLNAPPHNPIGLATVDRLETLIPELEATAGKPAGRGRASAKASGVASA